MVLINFAHPLTDEQRAQIERLLGSPLERVVDVPSQFDHAQAFAEQARARVDGVGLSSKEWQTTPLVVNPPSLSAIACVVLAELHGRMGYFPSVVRLRPVAASLPPRYEVAEIMALQAVRDGARAKR